MNNFIWFLNDYRIKNENYKNLMRKKIKLKEAKSKSKDKYYL